MDDEMILGYGGIMVGFIVPIMFAASVAAFLVTNAKLPVWRFSWVNKIFARIRKFRAADAEYARDIAKKNQFALGEPNFNVLAIWLVFLPNIIGGFGYVPFTIEYAPISAEEHGVSVERMRWVHASAILGWASVMSMAFFLIPVARHSVLLTAMGWSPIHALRIHIWAGYTAFLYAMCHTVTMFVVFWGYDKIPLRDQFIPPAECWAKDVNFTVPEGELHPPPSKDCLWQWWNLTGAFAMLWFVILWGTSLNWVRRKNYRLFYVCHVVFGSLMILCTFLHFDFSAIYMLPSTAYYIAATAPSLIQALASRYRGGNKIVRVVALQDAGGCMEFHVAADEESDALLQKEPNLYVKLCVPQISLIWHPFTVYRHPADRNIVRVLFRPVGPFTKLLALHLSAPERPVTIVDGFYRGSDRVAHALQHDHVSIITGGVAITPFLSLVPSLLQAWVEQPVASRVLKKITLHWAVREGGLEDYVTQEFLRVFMVQASESGMDFQVKVYQTRPSGGKFLNQSQASNGEVEEEPVTIRDDSSSGSDRADLIKVASIDDADATCPGKAVVLPVDASPGFAVEVARTMPARFSQMQSNIPYAGGFVCFMWLGFHMTFSHYSWNDDTSYSGLTKVTWYTILFVVLSVAYGAAVEVLELLYRKYGRPPQPDDFVLEEKKGLPVDTSKMDVSNMFETQSGRPTADQLLCDARMASAPGIFLCGPSAMCDSVWKEVRKENSFLGRTRYCMYDEPFEM